MSEDKLNIEVGQWVVLKDGKDGKVVKKITHEDMPDVLYEKIERYATKEEILENGGCPVDLELRMYFFVPYNISDTQKGIQAGHSLGRYALKYGRYDPTHIVWEFLEKWETFIILNGGTTNSNRDFTMISAGSLNQIADDLFENEIECAYMVEPDLNDALSAVCFICDERVFNKKDYPDFGEWLISRKKYKGTTTDRSEWENLQYFKNLPIDILKEDYPRQFEVWKEKIVGGDKNHFLRELIRDMKLA